MTRHTDESGTETRKIYLIRHARPEIESSSSFCISGTDIPLSEAGRQEALSLQRWFRTIDVSIVYSSPLMRCIDTACIMSNECAPVYTVDCLHEISVGEWEGLSFDEIRQRYPRLYAERGKNPAEVPPPGGETVATAAMRLENAIKEISEQVEGNITIVAHAGVNRSFLCRVLALPSNKVFDIPQPYCAINTLYLENGMFQVEAIGQLANETV